jgi:hypothetical protein
VVGSLVRAVPVHSHEVFGLLIVNSQCSIINSRNKRRKEMKTLVLLTTLSVLSLFAVGSAQVATLQAEQWAATGGTVLNTIAPYGYGFLTPGGQAAQYIDAGDWGRYPVTITTSGLYNLTMTFANGNAVASTMTVTDSISPASAAPVGARTIAVFTVAPTGTWATWGTQTIYGVPLQAGTHNIKLIASGGGDVDKITFTLLRAIPTTVNVLTQSCGLSAAGGAYTTVWSDEFTGATVGALPDIAKWNWIEGNWGWGNNEIQYNTYQRNTNTALDGAGHLVIKAVKEAFNGSTWTSARMTTKGLTAFKYGKIEYAVKATGVAGSFYSAGIIGDNYTDETNWPYCGEVRVFDYAYADGANVTKSSFHTRDHYGYAAVRNTATTVATLGTAYVPFTLYWTIDRLDLVVNGTYKNYYDKATYTANWPFANAMDLVMTIGVGGTRGGTVGAATAMTCSYDYVRVSSLDGDVGGAGTPVEKVINGTFNTDMNGWAQYVGGTATGTVAQANGACRATITAGGAADWNIQLNQPITYVNGQQYTLTFSAYSPEGARDITVNQQLAGGDYHAIGGSVGQTFALTTALKSFSYQFTSTEDQPLGRLSFNLGLNAYDVVLDNISLIQGIQQVPSAPANLTATAMSTGQINLAWTDMAGNEDGYYVFRSTSATKPGTATATIAANSASYSNTGLTTGTTYYFWVSAYNTTYGPSIDATVSAATAGNEPAAPSALSAATESAENVYLVWTDNSSNETGFKIYRSTASTRPATETATVGAGVTNYRNVGLTAGTKYYFWVGSYNASGNSVAYATANTTTLAGGIGWNVDFIDHFDGPALDATKWYNNWENHVNNEVQCYKTDVGAGKVTEFVTNGTEKYLRLKVLKEYTAQCKYAMTADEQYRATEYSASRLCSKNKFEAKGGAWEVRFKWTKPAGSHGNWPSIWFLTNRISERPVLHANENICWPKSGAQEYDMWEWVDDLGNTFNNNIIRNDGGCTYAGNDAKPTHNPADVQAWHTFRTEWCTDGAAQNDGLMRVYDNGLIRRTMPAGSATAANGWGDTMFILLQNAFGGDMGGAVVWMGSPYLDIDYVKHEKWSTNAPVPTAPAAPTALIVTASSSSQINLSWTDNSNNEAGFHVYMSTTTTKPATASTEVLASTATASISNLSGNVRYYFWVSAWNSFGESSTITGNAITPAPPSAPTAFSATASSVSQINLAWTDNATNETGFYVYQSINSIKPATASYTLAANAVSYSNTGLTAATTYYYWICAYNANGVSADAGPANTLTLSPGPNAPTTLAAAAASGTQIDLSWTDNSSDETGFYVYGNIAEFGTKPGTPLAMCGANATSFSHTSLTAGTQYLYWVCAYNANGSSSDATANATTQSAPNAPTALAATGVGASQIDLTWMDNASTETGYYVYRNTTNTKPGTATATLGASVNTYSNTGLSVGTTYYFWVSAFNTIGSSATVTTSASIPNPPTAPSAFSATPVSATQITLAWTDNAANETGYYVYGSTGTTKPAVLMATLAANVNSYGSIGLSANTAYYYWVCAFNGGGVSADVTGNSTTLTMPAAPTALSATAAGTTQINLAWTDNATNEIGYNLYRSTSTTKPGTVTVALAANTTSYSNTGLTGGTLYYYWLSATNSAGTSSDATANAATNSAGTQKITNGTFTTNLTGWITNVNSGGAATFAVDAGTAKATITNGGTTQYAIQFQQGITYTTGKSYSLSFNARSPEGNRTIYFVHELASGDYHAIGGSATQTFALTTTMQTFTYQFNCTETNAGGRINFKSGLSANDVVIDNVSLIEQ